MEINSSGNPIICIMMAVISIGTTAIGTMANHIHELAEFSVPFFQIGAFSVAIISGVISIVKGGGIFKKKKNGKIN